MLLHPRLLVCAPKSAAIAVLTRQLAQMGARVQSNFNDANHVLVNRKVNPSTVREICGEPPWTPRILVVEWIQESLGARRCLPYTSQYTWGAPPKPPSRAPDLPAINRNSRSESEPARQSQDPTYIEAVSTKEAHLQAPSWIDKHKDKLACQAKPEAIMNRNNHITSVLEEMQQQAEHDLGRHVTQNGWRSFSYKKAPQPSTPTLILRPSL